MIDIDKWNKIPYEDKQEYIEHILQTVNTECVSKADWEMMCSYLVARCNELKRNEEC